MKYILRSDETGPYTSHDVAERIDGLASVTVVDHSSPKMLLVDGPDDVVVELADSLPGWSASPERTVSIPDNRPMPESNTLQQDSTGPEPGKSGDDQG